MTTLTLLVLAALITQAGPAQAPPADDAQWLQVTPTQGSLPGLPTLTLLPESAPAGHLSATVELQASGDGLALAASIGVTAEVATGPGPRRPRARMEPTGSP